MSPLEEMWLLMEHPVRVSRNSLDIDGRQVTGGLLDALGALRYRLEFDDRFANGLTEAVRKFTEMLRELRELVCPFRIPKSVKPPRAQLSNRRASFFHAAKVDARNVP